MTDADMVETEAAPRTAGLVDLAGFFFGRREAILRIVDSKGGLWLGALFVLTAAVAREYDAESLVHDPWVLLGPFAASLMLASALVLIALA